MSEKCLKCFRPLQTCYCSYIKQVDTGVKFVFLMHPVEAYKQKTGTGRLASLSLTDSEIIIDDTFDNNKKTQALIRNPEYFPMILYPGKEACFAESFNFKNTIGKKKLLIFLIDATWIQARKMIFRSPSLQKLPRITFSREYRSRFAIKTQPADYCLSTIESACYLITELQKSGICNPEADTAPMISVFDRMVQYQIDCKKERYQRNSDKEFTFTE